MGKRCYLCGGRLPSGEVCFSLGVRSVCSDCADGITTEDLMHVTGTGTARAMLAALGFEKNVIF
ncbi:MAG: hypothetical protein E7636_00555 [Ruminococcaceae bacterium]|nr:hypothetical protein [Oscillospiraceae bacterium]MBQ2773086.1 hypothetical protein [Clostridia bacterium]